MGNLIPHPTSTHHNYFGGLQSMKNEKYIYKKNIMVMSASCFFMYFSFFMEKCTKIMLSGYSLDVEFHSPSNKCSFLKFE